jgi:hypothetical protein
VPVPVIDSSPINVVTGHIIDPTGELAKYGVQGSNIASANSIDLGAATGFFVNITGSVAISSMGTVTAGTLRFVVFTGSLTLTHNAVSLILPTGANITTAAGDSAIFLSLGSGNWKCVGYLRATGKALSVTAADIGLGNVENTALSTWAGSTNITTLGTIATGTWSGTAIGETKGGTGLTSYTQGDLLYASATNDLSKLAKDTNATRYLSNTGASNNPAWAQVDVSNGATGVLPTANGGSGYGAQTITAPTGTTATIDFASGNYALISLASATGNVTLTLQNPVAGQLFFIEVTQGGTARTLIFPAGTKQALAVGTTWTSSGASKVDIINLTYNGSNYRIIGTTPNIG